MDNADRLKATAATATTAIAESGISIDDLAVHTKIPAPALIQKLADTSTLTVDELFRLSEATGLPPSRFIS